MENKINFKINRKLTDEELAAVEIVKKLQENGFVSYFAGGAVRDELLGIPSYDIDIATSAKPEKIQKLFSKNFAKGKSFGVIVVKIKDQEFEVATFRTDIGIADHRRPLKIEFTNAQEDAKRRDFRINGLFFDPIKNQIIDYVEGIKDIKLKIIQFIGEPQIRIDEDYLRMLRAVRFSVRFNFLIEKKTKEAIKKNASKILEISVERIREEINKILLGKNRDLALLQLEELRLLREILPEIETTKNVPQPKEFHAEGTVWQHILLALKNIQRPYNELVWAVLLHDIAKPESLGFRSQIGKTSITFFDHDVRSAEKSKIILERLHFPHQFIKNVTWAITQHMRIIHAFQGMSERKQQKLFCDPNIKLLLDLTYADLSASLRPNGKPDMKMYEDAVELKNKFEKSATAQEQMQAKKFDLITGVDIMQYLKIKPGPEIGLIKKEIEKEYLDGKINNRDEAMKMLEKYADNT